MKSNVVCREFRVDIKQSNFQGDYLSSVVFVLALIQLSLILEKPMQHMSFQEAK